MSTYPHPSLEARVSALERRQIITDAHIEDLSQDMATRIKEVADNLQAGFDHLAQYQINTEHQIDTRFNRIEQRLDQHDQRFDGIDKRLDGIDKRLDGIEQHLTTQFTNIQTVLAQILVRLSEKP